jgi:hypothetical protein
MPRLTAPCPAAPDNNCPGTSETQGRLTVIHAPTLCRRQHGTRLNPARRDNAQGLACREACHREGFLLRIEKYQRRAVSVDRGVHAVGWARLERDRLATRYGLFAADRN